MAAEESIPPGNGNAACRAGQDRYKKVNIVSLYAGLKCTKMYNVIAHNDENHNFREKSLIMLTYVDTMSFTKDKETFIIDTFFYGGSVGRLADQACCIKAVMLLQRGDYNGKTCGTK